MAFSWKVSNIEGYFLCSKTSIIQVKIVILYFLPWPPSHAYTYTGASLIVIFCFRDEHPIPGCNQSLDDTFQEVGSDDEGELDYYGIDPGMVPHLSISTLKKFAYFKILLRQPSST